MTQKNQLKKYVTTIDTTQGHVFDFRRKITRTYKSVVIFHSIIVFKSVLSFAFQAEKDYLYKEGQFLIFLPNSLLPSFALIFYLVYYSFMRQIGK
jgi:hypothetical protein